MTKLEVRGFSISIDGFGAGADQRPDQPLGAGGERLHDWIVATRSWQRQQGRDGGEGGTTGVDDDFAAHAMADVGAWIIGRNMFGPVRGTWPDERGKAGGATIRRTTARCSC